MTYNEKKSLYENIMKEVAKTVKKRINESFYVPLSISDNGEIRFEQLLLKKETLKMLKNSKTFIYTSNSQLQLAALGVLLLNNKFKIFHRSLLNIFKTVPYESLMNSESNKLDEYDLVILYDYHRMDDEQRAFFYKLIKTTTPVIVLSGSKYDNIEDIDREKIDSVYKLRLD